MASAKSVLNSLLQGVTTVFFVAAGLAFFWGGRAIHEFTKTDRLLAEMEGIVAAVLLGCLGAVAKFAGEDWVSSDEDPSQENESLPK